MNQVLPAGRCFQLPSIHLSSAFCSNSAFDCVRGQGPGYFDDVLVPVHTVGARLRSADHGDMVVLGSCTVGFGQRSFRSSAPSAWNDLTSELKNSDINRQGFKSSLKSWLFERAYS